jgi:regulatory protein
MPDDREARQAALQLLARRDFCSAELAAKLCDRGFHETVVADLVQALQRERLVNDARYAEHFVSYHAARGQGPIRIGHELRRLKVPAELIERFLQEGQDWSARACEARRKRFGGSEPGSYAEKAKQARFLQYRGFKSSHIRVALGSDVDIGAADEE